MRPMSKKDEQGVQLGVKFGVDKDGDPAVALYVDDDAKPFVLLTVNDKNAPLDEARKAKVAKMLLDLVAECWCIETVMDYTTT